jgi:chemotaxis protein CheX
MIEDLQELLKLAASEVITTMLSFDVQFEGSNGEVKDDEPHVAGAVGFTGAVTGIVYLYSSVDFARQMTSAMLHLPVEEITEDDLVNESIGELTNMLTGRVTSRLSERGMQCALTIPSVVRGRNFHIEPINGAECRTLFVRCQSGLLRVEALVKLNVTPAPTTEAAFAAEV